MTHLWDFAGAVGVTVMIVGAVGCVIGLVNWMSSIEASLRKIEKHTRKASKP